MPVHYYNLSVSLLHLIIAGVLIYFFDERSIAAIISIFFGIVYLSQNQPLQYENKPQIVVVAVISIIAVLSFLVSSAFLIDKTDFPMTHFAGFGLAVINLIYFIKALNVIKAKKRK